jgi:thioredoxin 1
MSTRQSPTVEVNETNFELEVLQSKEPVVVDFWAEWCGPCKAIAPILEEIATSYSGRVKVAKVDVDRNFALAEHLGILSIPTLLYFARGQLRRQTVGLVSRKRIVDDLEAVFSIDSAFKGSNDSRVI